MNKESEVMELLRDWDLLITRISYMEIKLYNLKDELFNKEQDIIDNTDFKELYGKNNSDVRRKHLKGELKDLYDEVFTLEGIDLCMDIKADSNEEFIDKRTEKLTELILRVWEYPTL